MAFTAWLWLTDELFAKCSGQSQQEFNRWYAAGVGGGGFYLVWNIASFCRHCRRSQIPSSRRNRSRFCGGSDLYCFGFPINPEHGL
ncbi:hypothetical protein O9993_19330 [Vibrio lentus]|nr:hypothetical protein [Vibrio lentus]